MVGVHLTNGSSHTKQFCSWSIFHNLLQPQQSFRFVCTSPAPATAGNYVIGVFLTNGSSHKSQFFDFVCSSQTAPAKALTSVGGVYLTNSSSHSRQFCGCVIKLWPVYWFRSSLFNIVGVLSEELILRQNHTFIDRELRICLDLVAVRLFVLILDRIGRLWCQI